MDRNKKKHEWFVDLAPVSRSKDGCIYQSALNFGIKDKDIYNIALTGPYGSGKSSVIKGYKESCPEDVKLLEISLASFENEQPSGAEIELSILQQMIYSAPSDALPYSRFKRIKTPKKPIINATAMTLWIIGALILFQYSRQIFSIPLWSGAFYSLFFFITAFIFSSWWLIKHFYLSAFGASFKKISLKNIEVEKDVDSASILNKHVDEILYFFEQTEYNLVIFEDLDRFDSPDIFIKLRELNTLINKCHSVGNGRHVQFLYALKDSTFNERQRTKFFDFIIPVVPVIGTANSLDIITQRCKSLPELKRPLNQDFLRDVSDFLNDARLIHNIFNEFVIYIQEINDKNIDPTFLLALMVYKNVFGKDFEALHDSEGVFYDLVNYKKELLECRKSDFKAELSKLKKLAEDIDNERARSESELVNSYVGELIKHSPIPASGVKVNNYFYPFSRMNTFKDIEPLLGQRDIGFAQTSNHGISSSGKSFAEIEKKLDPNLSFNERVKLVGEKSYKAKAAINSKIADIEERIQELEQLKLADFLRESPKSIEQFTSKLKVFFHSCQNQGKDTSDVAPIRLFRFLILSGYLNEDYALYIAIFREREGWSANDRLFNTIMKSRDTAKPDLVIEHPEEVCARLKSSDFSSVYVLNVYLFDYLLSSSESGKDRQYLALNYVKNSFDSNETQGFFSLYFKKGKRLKELCNALLETWTEYFDAVIDGSNTDQHIAMILDCANMYLIEHHEGVDELRRYLEENLAAIYANSSVSAPGTHSYDVLNIIGIKVSDLSSISENPSLLSFIHAHLLFKINMSNIHVLLGLSPKDTSEMYSHTYCLLTECDENVTSYVNDNLEEYLEKVMLCNEQNREEPDWVVSTIIQNQSLSPDLKRKVISHQNYIFRSLDNVREELWQHLLQENKVAPTWGTIFKCYISQQVDNGLVVAFINKDKASQALRNDEFRVEESDEQISNFKRFIYNLDEVPDNIYERLNLGLNTTWRGFPSVSNSKKLLLVVRGLLSFNQEVYEQTEDNPELRVALIKQHYSKFQKEIEIYAGSIQHDVALELFQDQELPEAFKIELSGMLNVETLGTSAELSNLVSPYYLKVDDSRLSMEVIQRLMVLVKDQDVGIGLFKKFLENWAEDEAKELLIRVVKRWSKKTVMEAIELFPSAINTLGNYGKQPSIPNTEVNNRLVEALQEADCVGKVKIQGSEIRVYTKRIRPV